MGTLWIGTSEGLGIFRDGRIKALKTVPNSLREPVLGIAEDRYGSLWVATAERVLQVKSTSLVSGTPGYADVREYGPPDGLLGTEGVKRFVSVAADTQGRVWVSTNRGLSVVRPSRENTTSAIVHIDAFLADNSPLNLQEPIRIPSASQRVTVRYVGLSLSNPEHVRYRYKLDNFDHGWSEPIANREVSFTNLSPGPYVFRVMASNSDGLWNSKEVTFPFTVEPVFWRTWWFGLTSLLLLGLAALALIRLREHALARQLSMTFEARLAERTRIARDLHDTLLQSFNALLPRLQTVANALPERPDEAKRRIEGALEQATQAAIEGRDAVHELRSTGSMAIDLDRAIGDFARELLSGSTAESATEVYVQVEGSPKELNPAIRDEVFRIVTEATRNAVRHANAGQITIDIRYDASQLHLRISDDGTGIDPSIIDREHKPGHWGLRGMRERAKLVGGVLEIRNRPPGGTEITLNIPAASIYSKPSSRRWSVLSLLGRG
jgi:signal transduction histidine kinase